MPGRRGDYLRKRKGSQNWWLKLQYPARVAEAHGHSRLVERSMGTPDYDEAMIKALPLIKQHKELLYAHRLAKTFVKTGRVPAGVRMSFATPVGTWPQADGGIIAASETVVMHFDKDRNLIKQEPNEPEIKVQMVSDRLVEGGERVSDLAEYKRIVQASKKADRPDPDEQFLDTWIKQQGISGYLETEAREAFDTFKSLTDGLHFEAADRDDGRMLANHYVRQGNKSATVAKKVGHLRAVVHLAINDKKLKFNPFSSVVPKLDDALRRVPLDDDDMRVMRDNLHKLDPDERLLWTLISTTGMRRGEAWDIRSEFPEKGLRCVRIGTKTEQSDRRIPLPDAVLHYLPARITGPLFTDTPKNAGRNLLRAMRRFGITDIDKVLHSTRHRAKDVLRAEGCPEDIRYAILGHEEITVAASYGKGFPMTVLKPWIEKIGC